MKKRWLRLMVWLVNRFNEKYNSSESSKKILVLRIYEPYIGVNHYTDVEEILKKDDEN